MFKRLKVELRGMLLNGGIQASASRLGRRIWQRIRYAFWRIGWRYRYDKLGGFVLEGPAPGRYWEGEALLVERAIVELAMGIPYSQSENNGKEDWRLRIIRHYYEMQQRHEVIDRASDPRLPVPPATSE